MQRRRPAKVFRLRIVPPGADSLFAGKGEEFEDPASAIREAITPGSRVSRYGREWIVGQTDEVSHVLAGRIGFQGDPGTAEVWDDEAQDFLQTAVPSGMTAPFAIDLGELLVAIQPRNPTIKVNSLIGAFEALLTGDGPRWKLEPILERMSLSDWKHSVSAVTFVRFTIRKPNPHYADAHDLEDLMNQFESDVIQLEAQADTGINLQSDFLQETESHIERGYGDGEYKGIRMSDGAETIYSTRVGAEEQAELRDVDQETGEVPPNVMRRVLSEADEEENASHGRDIEGRAQLAIESGDEE